MEISAIGDFEEFLNQMLNNEEILSELNSWGKTVHILLDEKNYYFDFTYSVVWNLKLCWRVCYGRDITGTRFKVHYRVN